MNHMVEVLVPLSGCAMIVLIVFFAIRLRQTKVQSRTELHKHLLDKFSSGGELTTFLETEGGRKMLEELGSERIDPRERWLKSLRTGIILSFLGGGLIVLEEQFNVDDDLVIPGGVCLALGLGFTVAAITTKLLTRGDDEQEKGPSAESSTGSVVSAKRAGSCGERLVGS